MYVAQRYRYIYIYILQGEIRLRELLFRGDEDTDVSQLAKIFQVLGKREATLIISVYGCKGREQEVSYVPLDCMV